MPKIAVFVFVSAFVAVLLVLQIPQIVQNRRKGMEMLATVVDRVGGEVGTRPQFAGWLPFTVPIARIMYGDTPVELRLHAYSHQGGSGWDARASFRVGRDIDPQYTITRGSRVTRLFDTHLLRLPGEPSARLSTGNPDFDDRFVPVAARGDQVPAFLTLEAQERLLQSSQIYTMEAGPRDIVFAWRTVAEPSTDELVAFCDQSAGVFDAIAAALPGERYG